MDCFLRGREAPTGVIIIFYRFTNNKRNELVIKGAQALCRPGKEGVHLVWVMEERACCRKAAKEGTELLIENSSTEKPWCIKEAGG